MDDTDKATPALTDIELGLVQKAGRLAAEQLKVAKQVVTDGGFASASIAPILVAAVLQAIALNQSGLRN